MLLLGNQEDHPVTRTLDVVIVGHGSPEPLANEQFEKLTAAYQERHADWVIHHTYIELAEPLLEQTLRKVAQSGGETVVLLPLILLRAGHMKHDIPEGLSRIRAAFPHQRFLVAEPLDVDAQMVEIIRRRATECGVPAGRPFVNGQAPVGHAPRNESVVRKAENSSGIVSTAFHSDGDRDETARRAATAAGGVPPAIANGSKPGHRKPISDTAVIFVGRGCSDADANSNVCKLGRLLAEDCGGVPVFPCFIGVTRPSLEETLHLAALTRPRHMAIIPYFLFHGVLVKRIHEQIRQFRAAHPEFSIQIARHLDDGQGNLFDLMNKRVAAALVVSEGAHGQLSCTLAPAKAEVSFPM